MAGGWYLPSSLPLGMPAMETRAMLALSRNGCSVHGASTTTATFALGLWLPQGGDLRTVLGKGPASLRPPSLAFPIGLFTAVLPPRRDAANLPECRAWRGVWHRLTHVSLRPHSPPRTAHKCTGKWATLPPGQPAGSK